MNNYFTIMVILNQLNMLNGERTTSSVLHILNGKRSSQTIIDIQLFQLSPYFGLFDKLTRSQFDDCVLNATNNNWITNDRNAVLTLEGKLLVEQYFKTMRLPITLNGWQFSHLEQSFFQQLVLLTQVLSNAIFEEKDYIPLVKDKLIQYKIKKLLVNQNKLEVANAFFKEMFYCFQQIEDKINPNFVAIHLSGYKKSGKTLTQAAKYFELDSDLYVFHFKSCLHAMLHEIIANKNKYSLLYSLLDKMDISPITKSTIQTEELLLKGKTVDQIAYIRNLKISTIEDHLVELAMFREDFSIDTLVSNDLVWKINEASQLLNTKKLKAIKEVVPEATYLQIRLSLAKGDKK